MGRRSAVTEKPTVTLAKWTYRLLPDLPLLKEVV
jgi:hypothetical protein